MIGHLKGYLISKIGKICSKNIYNLKVLNFLNFKNNYGMNYDKKKRTISIYCNGKFLKILFSNINEKKLYPLFDIYKNEGSITFIKGLYKH